MLVGSAVESGSVGVGLVRNRWRFRDRFSAVERDRSSDGYRRIENYSNEHFTCMLSWCTRCPEWFEDKPLLLHAI